MRLAMALPLLLLACIPHDGPAPGAVGSLTLIPERTIGGADTGAAAFGDLRAYAVDPASRVWVLEGQAQEIRVFDSTGA